MAKVTYEIELNQANAGIIDQVNRILLGESETETNTSTAEKSSGKSESKKTESKAPANTGKTDSEISLADFKKIVKQAKADNGEDFCKQVLVETGATEGKTLIQMVNAIDPDDYADVVAALEAGPGETEEEEDDGLGDDDGDTSEVDADAVKTAAKAYAKEVGRDEAKEIMNANGAPTLAKIGDCSQKQLQAMFKAFTA